jgi:hypothetical protein
MRKRFALGILWLYVYRISMSNSVRPSPLRVYSNTLIPVPNPATRGTTSATPDSCLEIHHVFLNLHSNNIVEPLHRLSWSAIFAFDLDFSTRDQQYGGLAVGSLCNGKVHVMQAFETEIEELVLCEEESHVA